MLRHLANHPNNPVALDDLALIANFFDAGPNFHITFACVVRLYCIHWTWLRQVRQLFVADAREDDTQLRSSSATFPHEFSHMDAGSRFEIPQRLVTDRLILRRQEVAHAPEMRAVIEESYAEFSLWFDWCAQIPSVQAIEETIRRVRANWELGDQFLFNIFDHADRYLGVCGLEWVDWKVPAFEIGYWLRTSAVGKGLMSEAVLTLETRIVIPAGGRRVSIKCDERNIRSAAIPRRLGYTLEGVLRNERLSPMGMPQNTMVWAKVFGTPQSALV